MHPACSPRAPHSCVALGSRGGPSTRLAGSAPSVLGRRVPTPFLHLGKLRPWEAESSWLHARCVAERGHVWFTPQAGRKRVRYSIREEGRCHKWAP